MPMAITCRSDPWAVALETTLVVHGVPRADGAALAAELAGICRNAGSPHAFVGVVSGVPTVGMTEGELRAMLSGEGVAKVNTSNLGVAVHRRQDGATTVATTREIASAVGLRVFATGGLGGVHRGFAQRLDISGDLHALARFPMAVVTSGVKGLLDVGATRELLETLGVPVVGYRTDRFPAFYVRDGGEGVDARFDDAGELAAFCAAELRRTGRAIVVCNPIPEGDEIPAPAFESMLHAAEGEARARGAAGRDATPAILAALHRLSAGQTLRANLSLVKSNTALAASLARAMRAVRPSPFPDRSGLGFTETVGS